MKVMLTSCGIETDTIKTSFLEMLGKAPADAKALFIPTAAIDADAIDVLPKCMEDLLKCGIPKEQIQVFDLHRSMQAQELNAFDVIYFCGGRTSYLLERINQSGFRDALLSYIQNDGLVLGVSAGSLIFANNLPENLGLLAARLSVHCEKSSITGPVSFPLPENIALSNRAAMLLRGIPDDIEIVDDEMD